MIDNFFNISDLTKKEILEILQSEINDDSALKNKNIGLLFEKNSTRTRISFSVGISNLGGEKIDIRFEELNISRDESFEDTFRAMNCYLDGLIYRTKDHNRLIDSSYYFKKPIINALSDLSHPCQILSDLLTIQEQFGSLDCHILWMGDMNNVCFSLVEAANLINELKLTICSPSSIIKDKNWTFGSNVKVCHNLEEVDLSSVKCVMTDVFISMNDKEGDEKIKLLQPYAVSKELMSKSHTNSVFMHCLPAKVGYEVSEEVFKSSKSIVWKQAYNRLIAQKKLLQFMYRY